MKYMYKDTTLGFLFLKTNALETCLSITRNRDYKQFKPECLKMLSIVEEYEQNGVKEKPFVFSDFDVELGDNRIGSLKEKILLPIINDQKIDIDGEYNFVLKMLFYKCSAIYHEYFYIYEEFFFTVEMLKMLHQYYELIYKIEEETHTYLHLYGNGKNTNGFPIELDKQLITDLQRKLRKTLNATDDPFVLKELTLLEKMATKSLTGEIRFLILTHDE